MMKNKTFVIVVFLLIQSFLYGQQRRMSYEIEITNLALNGNPIRKATFYCIRDGDFYKTDTLMSDSVGKLKFKIWWTHYYIPGLNSTRKSLKLTVHEYIVLRYSNSSYFRFVKNKFWKYGYKNKGVYKVKVVWPIKVSKDKYFSD